jgi:hypothetical protein
MSSIYSLLFVISSQQQRRYSRLILASGLVLSPNLYVIFLYPWTFHVNGANIGTLKLVAKVPIAHEIAIFPFQTTTTVET